LVVLSLATTYFFSALQVVPVVQPQLKDMPSTAIPEPAKVTYVFAETDLACQDSVETGASTYLQAASSFQAGDFAIDEYRPIKVICIGAGFSGITAGIR